MKRPRIVAAMMLKLPIFVLILSQLFMHGSSCFTRPVHPETDFSHTTTHVADIGEEIVLVGPSPKVDLFNPAQKSWRELHYNSRNEMREEATITTLGSLLFVAGGQSYDDAHDMTGETMDVVDMHSSASWTVSFNRTLPIGSRAVAAGSMVLFYHPRSFTIMTYNMTDHVTTIMDKSIMYQGAAMYEEMIYLVDRARIDAYNTTDGTWRNTPLRARIRYGINLVFAARVNNAPTLLVVTFRDVVRVDPVSGTFTSLITIGFVRSGVIHNNLMVLLFGPSKAVVNSIVIYNVRDDHRYSWQYDDYSFRYSAVAALNNTLYIANWRPNANFDSGRRLLVYNVDHSHHDFIRLKPMDYVLQYRDSMVGAHFSSLDTRVTVHDLTSAQTTEIQVNFTQRGRVLARAAADYVFFYGGELEGSTEQPLDLLVLCMQTREQWYIATVPSPYRADMVRALGNLIFFPEDTDPVIHVFDASARQWTQRTELASKTIPDMVVRTADSIVYLSTIRDTTAFDIYYAASHTWKTLDLEVGSRLHGVALVQNHLYVAGGMASNGTLLNSLIIFSLNTTNKATVHLSQPRALPAVRQLGSYIAVIGGVKDEHLRLSDVINIFQFNGEIRHNMQLQQPERLGLNFGTTTIGDSLYSRYNSNVYRFDSNAPSSTTPNPHRLLLPVMAGSAIRAVGSFLVAWGEFYNQQEFYFYDTTTPTSLHLITPLSRGVFFWRNSVILYFNGIMKIYLPVVSSLKEKTLYLPDHASWTPSAYGRGLKYSWEMRPLGQLELRIPGVAETFDIGPCQLQGGKHELSLTITDRCGLSTRVIGGVNVIPAPNVTPAGWKSDYECNSSPKLYALVEHAANPQWMIDGRSRTGDTLVLEGLTCGRTYNICVLASNPSGVTSKCKDIRINANLLKILLPIAGGLGLGLVATVVGVTRRKFMKVKKQELELKSMLSEAKREMIDSKAGKIISSTSWEWTPSDAYTYCALNQLPVTFDTSQLGFDKKHGPLDINIWFQGTIMATSKKKAKTGRLSFLHLSLLDDEHRFDIYAPQSPKFEVNVDPSSFVLSDGGAVMLTVWIKLKITTKADIQLVIVSERTRRYSSITFTVVGKPSPWIDVDDVEVSDQILGQGGFGTVKKGTYKGQSVAVKILLNQYMTIHTKTEFEREVAVMSSLHHPNIVQFVGASNIEGKLALVTELAPLGNLASILEESLLSVQLKIIILLEIARAIQFLHSNSVIHRDIKPLNVLVYSLEYKAMCHVKLTDFGTSKFVSDSAAMTMTQNIGTTKYMAPETLGKKPRFDKAADVYSFAILAWEVITNEHAFAAAEFQWQSEIENFVLKGGRLPIPADMNDKLACLITQCWHQDATKRPSISEVVQQLSKFIYGDSYAFV